MYQEHEKLTRRIRNLETTVAIFALLFGAFCVVSVKDRMEFRALQKRLDAVESQYK